MERYLLPRRSPPRAGAALDVEGDAGGLVEDLPARVPEAMAPVEVLHVEPVALVEQADLGDRLGPAEHEGAVHRVDLARFVLVQVRRPVLRQRLARARAAANPGEVGERGERGG